MPGARRVWLVWFGVAFLSPGRTVATQPACHLVPIGIVSLWGTRPDTNVTPSSFSDDFCASACVAISKR